MVRLITADTRMFLDYHLFWIRGVARFSEGIYEPITVLILASMVTPFGLTIAYFLGKIIRKNILNRQEIDTLKTAFPMGICQITEGCFLSY